MRTAPIDVGGVAVFREFVEEGNTLLPSFGLIQSPPWPLALPSRDVWALRGSLVLLTPASRRSLGARRRSR
eukprot:13252391-Alexandrium_andersonii.AAC.1